MKSIHEIFGVIYESPEPCEITVVGHDMRVSYEARLLVIAFFDPDTIIAELINLGFKVIDIAARTLRLLVRLSGLRQEFIAEQFGITPEYLWLILDGRGKAKRIRIQIYNYLRAHNTYRGFNPVMEDSECQN